MAERVESVGLNALFLDPGASGGPETVLRELVPALASGFPAVRFEIATTRRGAQALRADGFADVATIHALPAEEGQRARRTIAEQVLLPRLAARRGWSVLHSLASIAPIRTRTPAVITLHDVTFLKIRTFSFVTTFGMGQVMRRASRRADALIAGSAAARDEICDQFGLDPALVSVVPHGPGRTPSAQPVRAAELRARHRLDEDARVVLCVAAKRPHKNQELLVRAAAELPAGFVIVLAGHPEPYDAELRRLAAELGVESSLRFVDYVTDADLEGLSALACCFAVPTLAEGFGLPVLEAMRRGVPVACSDIAVLHEVGGDAARYFDPHDSTGAARAILAACDDREAAAAGVRRAESFSWRETARGTFAAYERALAAAAGRSPCPGTTSR